MCVRSANNDANTNGVGFSSNGQRGRSNNFEIDGQSNNDNSVTGPQFFFRNEDAVQEIQVITNNFGAQYGRNAGSIVNYITKSGTNSFHGAAFENYVGSWGSSLTQGQKSALLGFCAPGQVSAPGAVCATPVVPRVTANEFGGALGGPVLKDKTLLLCRRTLPPDHQRRVAIYLDNPYPYPSRVAAAADRLPGQPIHHISAQPRALFSKDG